jgi:hypothetical protein
MGTVEESDIAFGNRLAFVSFSSCRLLSVPQWWNPPDGEDAGSFQETTAVNQVVPVVSGEDRTMVEEGWPCLVFGSAPQLRRVLGKSKRYNDDVRQIRTEILSHIHGGGKASDPVAYVLGDRALEPCERRLIFLPPADVAPLERLSNTDAQTKVSERLSAALTRNPCPSLRSALHDALYIHWCTLRASEHEQHPMPSPGEHAPSA